MKYYHMIIERKIGWDKAPEGRKLYISPHQGSAPDGWKCVGVCGYHEAPKEVQYPCRSCVYFHTCGDSMRTAPCEGRKTKRQVDREF